VNIIKVAGMPDNFDLALAGDPHSGSCLTSTSGIKRMQDWVMSEKHRYLVLHGDMIEAIMCDDKRLDGTSITHRPSEQMKMAVKLWRPVCERILVLLEGNHEMKLWKYGNIAEDIARELGCAYGTYTSKIAYYDGKNRLMFKHYATHGHGQLVSNAKDPEQRVANMKAALKFRLKDMAGDCALMSMGHTHQLLVVPPSRRLFLYDDGTKIKQKYMSSTMVGSYIHEDERWYANTGSFYRQFAMGVSGYSEVRGYKPTELGYVRVAIRDRAIVDMSKEVV